MNKSCPICGSNKVNTVDEHNSVRVIYGKNAEYFETVDHCSSCGEEGDFSSINDAKIESSLNAARKDSVCQMINYLQEHDIKMAYLERALELPARTVNRWKTTDCSAAPLALLRIIRTYPWILEVADADYDESVSSSKLLEQAAKVLAIALERNKINTDYSKVDANTMSVTITTKPIYKMVSRFETGSIGEHSL